MSDDLVDRLRGNCPSIPAMRDAAKEIDRLRAERDEAITERDRLFIRGREWAELSGRMERERDALRARAELAEGRIDWSPEAVATRNGVIRTCVGAFPAGQRVALVVVND